MPINLIRLIPLSKNSVIFILVTVNVVAIAYILSSRDAVKRAELMYLNPSVNERIKIKYIEGPVKIIERIIESPDGNKVTERTTVKEPVTVTKESESSKTPVSMGDQSKYLLGFSWHVSQDRAANGTVWAGYSFGRLDVLGGVQVQRDETPSAHLMAITRWGS